jgi:hypothetical protein
VRGLIVFSYCLNNKDLKLKKYVLGVEKYVLVAPKYVLLKKKYVLVAPSTYFSKKYVLQKRLFFIVNCPATATKMRQKSFPILVIFIY